jgi:heme/copper-type cytochrome/quinol oxidase subunit 2
LRARAPLPRALALTIVATAASIIAVIALAERPWQTGSFAEQTSSAGVQEVRVRVFAWGFSPSIVHVSRGQTVRFVVSTEDLRHGFAINELGINLQLAPGQDATSPTVVVNVADGVYPIHCSAFCGLGHASMKGRLVVGAASLTPSPAPWLASGLAVAIACGFAVLVGEGSRRRR